MLNNQNEFTLPSFLPLLIMLYLSTILLGYLFSNKEMHIFLGTISPGSLILPLCFVLADIIAEVYGYQIAKQVIWSGLIAQAFFFLIGTVLAYLPDPGSHDVNYTPAIQYQGVFGILPRTFFCASLGYVIGMFLNTYLISKWKILLKGKYFWLRSIGSSTIGEFAFTLIGISLICLGRFPIGLTIEFVIASYLVKMLSSVVYAYPAAIITKILKKNIGLHHQYPGNYNPFNQPFG